MKLVRFQSAPGPAQTHDDHKSEREKLVEAGEVGLAAKESLRVDAMLAYRMGITSCPLNDRYWPLK